MKSRPRIFLATPCLVPHDAVGNDVYGMYELLKGAGYEVHILAEEFHATYSEVAERFELESSYWNSDRDLLIYHHSIGWPLGESVLAITRNRLAIRYHNITPASFYRRYARHYYDACLKGQAATRRIAQHRGAMFWGASRFNAEELIALGAPREQCRWLAPCHLTEELRTLPLELKTLAAYRDGKMNVLFVGGMKPNKGHLLGLEAFAAFRAVYKAGARIVLVGSYDPGLSSYLVDVKETAKRLGVAADTVFEHSVPASRLRGLYYAADVFLCTSEHEGFCVPLLEAMAFRVPILAWSTTAVGETVGDTGLTYASFDPLAFADGLHRYHRDRTLLGRMQDHGRRRYERLFHPDVLRERLFDLVRELSE